MHILFVHPHFPGQFGYVAGYAAESLGWRTTFVSRTPPGHVAGIEKIQYHVAGGASVDTHFCSRPFENAIWHCDAIYKAMKARPDVEPDLIVGHSGFGSTLFLREIYPQVPVINLFEFYYDPDSPDSDMNFRHDLEQHADDAQRQRVRCRNAMTLLDLQNCTVGYTPTRFQHLLFPRQYASKLRVVPTGVDRAVYHSDDERLRPASPPAGGMRQVAGYSLPTTTRVVTYVSSAFESIRGFDLFMRASKLITERFPDVIFFVVGTDRAAPGAEKSQQQGDHKSFKEWVLARDNYDLTRFVFPGHMQPAELAELLGATDVHVYLTVPFPLSTSMLDAMSCGAVVLGSATPPVQEVIADGQNGLLVDFFDVEDMAAKTVRVLQDPPAFRSVGRLAERTVAEAYGLDVVLPQMVRLCQETARTGDRVAVG